MVIIGVDTLLCIIISGYYLGTPLLYILGWIKQLANGDFTPFQKKSKMYSKKNKLHLRFQLYSEVIMQVEQLRQQLLAAKQASEEMETGKRDWIAGVSHDLKTPLTYIKSYAALLNAAYDWSEEEKSQFLQDIYDKGTHMEQLVNDLNLALRFDSDQIIPIYKESKNIISFIQQLLADIMNDPRAENTQFIFDFNQEKIWIAFDPTLLKRALENIYLNAIIHNESDIIITTKVHQNDEVLTIRIQDNGQGLDEMTEKNLFNRYYRGTSTNQKSEGTGLGMAIVKSLIEAHGGLINIDNTAIHGVAFIITIPFDED